MWVLAKINNKSPVRGKSGLKISAATVTTDNNGATPEKNTRKRMDQECYKYANNPLGLKVKDRQLYCIQIKKTYKKIIKILCEGQFMENT